MALTQEDKDFLNRITTYANEKMPDLDPQKTHVSVQLETLKPLFMQIAKEENVAVEDIFIKYMDLANEAFIASDKKLKEALDDRMDGNIFTYR